MNCRAAAVAFLYPSRPSMLRRHLLLGNVAVYPNIGFPAIRRLRLLLRPKLETQAQLPRPLLRHLTKPSMTATRAERHQSLTFRKQLSLNCKNYVIWLHHNYHFSIFWENVKVCLADWWLVKSELGSKGKRLAVAGLTSREYVF